MKVAGLCAFCSVGLFAVDDVEAAEYYQRGSEYGPGTGDVAEQEIPEQCYPQQVGILERRNRADNGNAVGLGDRQERTREHHTGEEAEGEITPRHR